MLSRWSSISSLSNVKSKLKNILLALNDENSSSNKLINEIIKMTENMFPRLKLVDEIKSKIIQVKDPVNIADKKSKASSKLKSNLKNALSDKEGISDPLLKIKLNEIIHLIDDIEKKNENENDNKNKNESDVKYPVNIAAKRLSIKKIIERLERILKKKDAYDLSYDINDSSCQNYIIDLLDEIIKEYFCNIETLWEQIKTSLLLKLDSDTKDKNVSAEIDDDMSLSNLFCEEP